MKIEPAFLKGMDLSFVDEIESEGGAYYDNGVQRDVLDILRDNGVNSVRLRLWNEPKYDYTNLKKTIQMAKRVKDKNMHFLLDFHYSDYWADPGKQYKPKAWEGLSFPELTEALKQFTKQTILALKEQGALPDMVQIGNEITNGMVWDDGRVGDEWDTPEQWSKLAKLIQAGIDGVNEATGDGARIPIMLHVDRGGDNEGSRYFYDRIFALGVDFDVIGLSYYPWWHGTVEAFTANMNDLAVRYNKDIVVVETAYPWTTAPKDADPATFKIEEWSIPDYAPTPEGQAAFLAMLLGTIKETAGGRGIGVYYWEPCWIPSKPAWSVEHDNNWSHLTMFDYDGNKLDSLSVFKR